MTAVLELALRPLPQSVKPFPGEIVSSYVGRLADVNRLDNTALLQIHWQRRHRPAQRHCHPI
jgi:hypothetical protein